MILGEDAYWEKEYKEYQSEVRKNSTFSFEDYSPAKAYSQEIVSRRVIFPLLNKTEKTCLELGSGSGFMLSLLSKWGINCFGIDRSKKAILFSKYLCKQRNAKVNLLNKDIFDFFSSKKFSLVFNSGVIEHYSLNQQNLLIKKMISLSNKYILICIPNNKSPIYLDFIDYVKKSGNFYNIKEYSVDVEKLFRKNKISLILKDGFHIFNSRRCYLNNRRRNIFKFYKLLCLRLGNSDLYYKGFFNRDYFKADICQLTLLENAATPKERFKFGFMRLYLGVIK